MLLKPCNDPPPNFVILSKAKDLLSLASARKRCAQSETSLEERAAANSACFARAAAINA